jgi:uncharacterized protein (DUF433 family)
MNESYEKTVVRTDRGLSVDGTRITLYSIMDYVKAGWPAKLIRDRFDLTDKQVSDVLEYIRTHTRDVEAEYELVLKQAQEDRRYWEARNRERFAQIDAMGPPPGKEELWKKIQNKKQQLGLI